MLVGADAVMPVDLPPANRTDRSGSPQACGPARGAGGQESEGVRVSVQNGDQVCAFREDLVQDPVGRLTVPGVRRGGPVEEAGAVMQTTSAGRRVPGGGPVADASSHRSAPMAAMQTCGLRVCAAADRHRRRPDGAGVPGPPDCTRAQRLVHGPGRQAQVAELPSARPSRDSARPAASTGVEGERRLPGRTTRLLPGPWDGVVIDWRARPRARVSRTGCRPESTARRRRCRTTKRSRAR